MEKPRPVKPGVAVAPDELDLDQYDDGHQLPDNGGDDEPLAADLADNVENAPEQIDEDGVDEPGEPMSDRDEQGDLGVNSMGAWVVKRAGALIVANWALIVANWALSL